MIENLIIGKNSNLSIAISKKIENCHLISARDINSNIKILDSFKINKINLIFNNFQPATKLNELNDSENYIINTILITAKILDYFKNCDINKIIYTSSSSVYGSNIFCNEYDDLKPMNMHASLKVANEMLIKKYCLDNNIDYTITRLFNMYGENDNFSIVSKLISAVNMNNEITIVNNGNAIRDFIHIDDVVDIYAKLLDKKGINIINIGTGTGNSIKNILDFFKSNNIKIQTKNIFRNELKTSTSNNKLLYDLLDKKIFIKIEDFLKKEFNL